MGLAELDDQIDKLRTELRSLSSTYGDQYPEVRRVKDQIAKAEVQRDQLLADLNTKGNKTPSADDAARTAVGAGGSKDASSLAQLQSELQANAVEIRNREQSIAALTAQINEYQARLNEEPVREQQLTDLNRGYDQSKASYDDLLKKKNDSAMATSMELLQQGERFRIIDAPSLPIKPSFPNRLKFCGFGLLAGLALGVGCVLTAEMLDDRVYGETELRKLLPASVLSELRLFTDRTTSGSRKERTGWAGRQRREWSPQCLLDLRSATGRVNSGGMYKAFYNLKRSPFAISPDPAFLFSTPRHNEAMAALLPRGTRP